MVTLTIESPTVLRMDGIDPSKHGLHFKFINSGVDYQLNKLKHSHWATKEQIDALKAERNKTLLFEDDKGYWTYAGLASTLKELLHVGECTTKVTYPKSKTLPWSEKPFDMYPYQEEALEKLIEGKHCAVSMATGLGKSLIITYLVKNFGLQTIVMAPSGSIAGQLYDGFVEAFGRKYVGMYGGGKKDSKKLITVALAQSLTRIEPGSEAWKHFSKTEVFVSDESHLVPAVTFEKVCHNLVKNAPYRFFFSATQFRNDGQDLLLDSITGPVVFEMDIKKGIEQGYLAKQSYTMIKFQSDSTYDSRDVNEVTRRHLYYSPVVNKKAAEMANKFIEAMNLKVLILVDELEQFTHLLPYFRHTAGFAHSGVTADNKKKIPLEYHESDPKKLVEQFNKGNLPILVGTSCVSVGTDVRANGATINLCGGKSEIQVIQGPVGRSTRKCKEVGKESCYVVDFYPMGNPSMERHAKARAQIYNNIAPVRILEE